MPTLSLFQTATTSICIPNECLPQLRKEAYGAKVKDITDQYAKYIPPEFVPDRFSLPEVGLTGMWKQTTLTTSTSDPGSVRSTQGPAIGTGQILTAAKPPRKVRWSASPHSKPLVDALVAPPVERALPKRQEGWALLVTKIPDAGDGQVWDLQTLKRHAKLLAKTRSDIGG